MPRAITAAGITRRRRAGRDDEVRTRRRAGRDVVRLGRGDEVRLLLLVERQAEERDRGDHRFAGGFPERGALAEYPYIPFDHDFRTGETGALCTPRLQQALVQGSQRSPAGTG